MKLYDEHGYLNFPKIMENDDTPFIFVIGGRGTGKTYGALKYGKEYNDKTGKPYIFMRRTQTKADIISSDVFSPYNALNSDMGWNVKPFNVSKGVKGYYNAAISDDGKEIKDGLPIAYIMALTTFASFRGFDASMVPFIIYDEFIATEGEKSIKNEGFILKNVFETVNRNRELWGKNPCKMVCLSNSDYIGNDVFVDLGLVGACEHMIKSKQNAYFDYGRGIAIYNLFDSPVSAAKRNTALYRMDQDSSFTRMSLSNEFLDYSEQQIRSVPLIEYRLLCIIGELAIYRHKNDQLYYITNHVSGKPVDRYDMDHISIDRFIRKYGYIWECYLNAHVIFQSYLYRKIFENIFLKTY